MTIVGIPSQKAFLNVFSGKFVLAPRCSRALLHNLQPSSNRCLILASHLSTGIILAIAIVCHLLCLQGTCGSFKYFPKKALLLFCCNRDMKLSLSSTCHMQGDWYYCALHWLAHTILRIFCHQSQKIAAAPSPWPCCGTIPLCVHSSMSSFLQHLSYRRQSVLICLQAPVSFFSCFCSLFYTAPLRIAFFYHTREIFSVVIIYAIEILFH